MFDHYPTVASNGTTRHPASELQELLLATDVLATFLQELADFAVCTIGGDVSASVTVTLDGHPTTAASSDAHAAQYDEVQYSQNEGPGLTAMRIGKVVLINDLAGDERFSQYRPHALALGVRSCLSLPLSGENNAVGALSLYSRRTHGFGPTAQAEAKRFADEASRALTLAIRVAHDVEITEQLVAALSSRTMIDRGVGIIMGHNRCDAHTAFAVLRGASQNRNVTLRVVATGIISAVGNKPPTNGHPFRS